MAPTFIQRNRQRFIEAAEERVEQAALAQPPRARNPFLAAADDLAAQWDAMAVERDVARDDAERLRGENIFLSGKVDELTRELASRIEFFSLEIDRSNQRADRAVDDATAIRAKLAVIAQALRMVLDEEQPVAKREPRREPRHSIEQDFTATPPQGHEVEPAEVAEIGSLLNRLVPVKYPTGKPVEYRR